MADSQERTVAGRYRLRQRLGAGGGGSVWLAEDLELNVKVALKQFSVTEMPDEPSSGDRTARGRREALKAAQLREHPNVVTVYDVVRHQGRPWIVMEYLPGTMDLAAVVRERGPLPAGEIARIGAAALDGLSCGHRLGIIHRDVKPSNILLAPDHLGVADGRVLLTDYGISLRAEETRLTQSGMVIGTLGYVAPERLFSGEASPASDLFSLGVTLYFAAEGTAPFDRDTYDAVITATLKGEPPVPRRAAGRLGEVIMGLLAKDPRDRTPADEAAAQLTGLATAGGAAAPARRASAPDPRAAPPGQPGEEAGPTREESAAMAAGTGSPAPAVPHSGSEPAPASEPASEPASGPASGSQPAAGVVVAAQAAPVSPVDGPPFPAFLPAAPADAVPGGPAAPLVPAGPPRAGGRRTPVLLAVAGLLLAGGGFAAGAAAFHGTAHPAKGARAGGPAASPSPTVTRSAYPYGTTVALRDELQPGQCLDATWKGGTFKGTPKLKQVDCYDDNPDGEVITTIDAGHRDARSVRAECTRRTAQLRATMAGSELYVLPPGAGQSNPPRSACVLFLHDATLGGPLGNYRKLGDHVYVTTLGPGDCFDSGKDKDGKYTLTLADCDKPHSEQAVGWTRASGEGSADGVDMAQLCRDKYGIAWARGQADSMTGWYSSGDEWEKGYRYILCTVNRGDDGKLPAGAVKPAY